MKRISGVPSGEPDPRVHGSAAVSAGVQEARRRRRRRRGRPQKRSERFQFEAGEHTAQTGAGDRTPDMIRGRSDRRQQNDDDC